jgi:SHS2 domain-containing protein
VGDAGHSFVEHTSEVELHLFAPTLPALFAQAGRALAELMLGEGSPAGETVTGEVSVTAPDREALLAAWIDELIFQGEIRKAVFTSFQITHLGDGTLTARLGGIAEPVIKTAVKAATFHDLRIAEEAGGFVATVVLDV